MSNEKFTHGEWVIDIESHGVHIHNKESKFPVNLAWLGNTSAISREELLANAYLIRAAPNLYHALKDLVGNSRENWQEVNVSKETIDNALKALKKARGEECLKIL